MLEDGRASSGGGRAGWQQHALIADLGWYVVVVIEDGVQELLILETYWTEDVRCDRRTDYIVVAEFLAYFLKLSFGCVAIIGTQQVANVFEKTEREELMR